MLDRKYYCGIDIVVSTISDFINRVAGCTELPKMNRVLIIPSYLMITVTSSNWRRGWTRKEVKEVRAEVCEIEKEVVELFSSLCNSGIFKIRLHLLDHLAKIVIRFGRHVNSRYRCFRAV